MTLVETVRAVEAVVACHAGVAGRHRQPVPMGWLDKTAGIKLVRFLATADASGCMQHRCTL
jgi:hypothetical protein